MTAIRYLSSRGAVVGRRCKACARPFEYTKGSGRLRVTCDRCTRNDERRGWTQRPNEHAVCPGCTKSFIPRDRRQRICSDCWYELSKTRPWSERRNFPTVRDHNARKRARRKGVYITKIDRRLLYYVHGGGVCALCHDLIDSTAKARRALSASLDHIVPLSGGGVHDWPNVQLAHYGCNASKGWRIAA